MEKENKTGIKLRLRNIVLLFLLLIVLFKIFVAFTETSEALTEILPPNFTITSKDSSLFAPAYRNQLKVLEVKRNKSRENLMVFSIGEQYFASIEKLRLSQDISLTKAIHFKKESNDRTPGVTYVVYSFLNYSYQQKSGITNLASSIYLSFSGDSIQRHRFTDNSVSFSLNAESISLSYAYNSPIDIFIKGEEKFTKRKLIPMNIMFLKKNEAIYLIVLTEKNGLNLPKINLIDNFFIK